MNWLLHTFQNINQLLHDLVTGPQILYQLKTKRKQEHYHHQAMHSRKQHLPKKRGLINRININSILLSCATDFLEYTQRLQVAGCRLQLASAKFVSNLAEQREQRNSKLDDAKWKIVPHRRAHDSMYRAC